MKKLTFVSLMMLLAVSVLWGQPWTYDFGTGTGSYTTASGVSTTFLPTPSSGTARVRVGGAGGGGFYLDNPGLASLGTATELRIVAPTGTSVGKFSLYDYTAGKTFMTKFDMLLGSSSGGTASPGAFLFFQGDGANYSDNNGFSGTAVFTGIQMTFGTGGTITSQYRSGSSWLSLGSTPFAQSTVYTVEIYGNNTTSSSTYGRSSNSYTVAANTWDIWVNGTLIGDDLAKALLANDVNIDSFMFYCISSTGNVANCFLDNFTYSNALPAPSVSAPTTQAYNISFGNIQQNQMDVSWTNGDGGKRIVVMNSTNSFTNPTDGTDPTPDTSWNGAGEQVVFNGTGSSQTVTALAAGTTYYFRAYEYNGSGTGTKYLTSTATNNPNSQQTASNPIPPTLTTTAISAITNSSAASGGTITSDGGASITAKGVCWNTTGTPTITSDSYTTDGTGTDSYVSAITPLNAGTQYYVRAYATNSAGTNYGDELVFTTLKAEPTNHVSNFTAGTATASSIPLSWTDAAKVAPDGYLIKASTVGFSSITDPTDGVAEANAALVYNVNQGIQNLSFNNLDSATTYYFKIYPYTNSGTGIDYKTNGTVPQASATTGSVTILNPGDIAIIAFQTDTDQFAFITLTPISEGTQINFTDNGWKDTGALNTTEGTLTWTAPGGKIAMGEIVTITYGTSWTADKGTVSVSPAPSFSTSGDQIIAYQGASTSPTLIYAISTMPWVTSGTITSNTTYLPTGLTDGDTAVAFTTEIDDQYYNVTPITGTPESVRTSIANESNWTRNNTQLTLPEWEVGTLPVELSSFTAIVNSQNMVSIQWVSQSETNLNGYYVNRSASPVLSEATIVSPLISASNTSNVQLYQFTDSELVDSGTYYYWLQVQEMDGSTEFHGPISVIYNAGGDPGNHNVTPIVTEITGIYPNPFNPSATIRYALTKDAQVNMVIYNARGQIIRTMNEGFKTVGTHPLIWDGKDNTGRTCSTGVYFFKMQAGNVTSIKKAVLMK